MNIQLSRILLYLKLPAFFSCFSVNFGKISLCFFYTYLFLNIYTKFLHGWGSRRHFQQSSKLKLFLLTKINIKQNPRCPIKECNAILKHIHQNNRTYSKSKGISALINELENIAYQEKSVQSVWLADKFGLFHIQLGDLGGVVVTGKFCDFYPNVFQLLN